MDKVDELIETLEKCKIKSYSTPSFNAGLEIAINEIKKYLKTSPPAPEVITAERVELRTVGKIKLEVEEITLLSIEEYEKHKKEIPAIHAWWWLRSPGCCVAGAASVSYGGSVCRLGGRVSINGSIRPALRIKQLEPHRQFTIGTKFVKAARLWTIISDDLAICDGTIKDMPFSAVGDNNYENSDVKRFIEEWWEKAKELD